MKFFILILTIFILLFLYNQLTVTTPTLTKVHSNPDIYLIKNLLTTKQCNHLEHLNVPYKRSRVMEKNKSEIGKGRTSHTHFLTKSRDPIVKNIEDKAVSIVRNKYPALSNITTKNLEPLQLVKYENGQEYKFHYDYIKDENDKELARGGQRTITIFAYVKTPHKGGNTCFKKIDQCYHPERGDALMWNNSPGGKVDPKTLHAGMPVQEGTKIGLNVWFRERDFK